MIDYIIGLIQQMVDLPRPAIAMIAGTLGSWGVTQRIKFLIPADWQPKVRELYTQALAFLGGFFLTLVLFPWSTQPEATVAALIVGLWSPAWWNIGTTLIRMKWPAIADKLSQENR